MLDLKKEQKTQYKMKVTSMAKALGFKVGVNFQYYQECPNTLLILLV